MPAYIYETLRFSAKSLKRYVCASKNLHFMYSAEIKYKKF